MPQEAAAGCTCGRFDRTLLAAHRRAKERQLLQRVRGPCQLAGGLRQAMPWHADVQRDLVTESAAPVEHWAEGVEHLEGL